MTETEAREMWTLILSVIGLILWVWFMVWFIKTMNRIRTATEEGARANDRCQRELQEANRWLRQLAEREAPQAPEPTAEVEEPKQRAEPKPLKSQPQTGSCPNCTRMGIVGELCDNSDCRRGGFRFTPDRRGVQ
jgi:hypothetical protein